MAPSVLVDRIQSAPVARELRPLRTRPEDSTTLFVRRRRMAAAIGLAADGRQLRPTKDSVWARRSSSSGDLRHDRSSSRPPGNSHCRPPPRSYTPGTRPPTRRAASAASVSDAAITVHRSTQYAERASIASPRRAPSAMTLPSRVPFWFPPTHPQAPTPWSLSVSPRSSSVAHKRTSSFLATPSLRRTQLLLLRWR